MAELSLIVPCHDIEATADDLLSSLERNGFDELEVIFVDDGSADRTSSKLCAFAADRPWVHLARHDRCRGVSAARNTGLTRASGRWVTFLDADDWLAPGYLESLLVEIRRLDVAFIRVDHIAVTGRCRRVARVPEYRRNRPMVPIDSVPPANVRTGVDYPYCWAGIYDTERISSDVLRFDEALRTAEDRVWIWRLYLAAPSYAVVGLSGIFHRDGGPSSLTGRTDDSQLDFLPSMRAVTELAQATGSDELVHKAIATLTLLVARHIRLSRRFSAEVRRALLVRSAEELARIPDAHFDATLGLIPRRRALLMRSLRHYGRRRFATCRPHDLESTGTIR